MKETEEQYGEISYRCRKVFDLKNDDYGLSWKVLRVTSLTDQIYIKALRIRSLQEKGVAKVDESIYSEFQGIYNYCMMALINLEGKEVDKESVLSFYDFHVKQVFDLMKAKNHDYGEAWRELRVSSMTDLVLMKVLRIKSIEGHLGKVSISEGVDANYSDIANYAIFCMILLENDFVNGNMSKRLSNEIE